MAADASWMTPLGRSEQCHCLTETQHVLLYILTAMKQSRQSLVQILRRTSTTTISPVGKAQLSRHTELQRRQSAVNLLSPVYCATYCALAIKQAQRMSEAATSDSPPIPSHLLQMKKFNG